MDFNGLLFWSYRKKDYVAQVEIGFISLCIIPVLYTYCLFVVITVIYHGSHYRLYILY